VIFLFAFDTSDTFRFVDFVFDTKISLLHIFQSIVTKMTPSSMPKFTDFRYLNLTSYVLLQFSNLIWINHFQQFQLRTIYSHYIFCIHPSSSKMIFLPCLINCESWKLELVTHWNTSFEFCGQLLFIFNYCLLIYSVYNPQ